MASLCSLQERTYNTEFPGRLPQKNWVRVCGPLLKALTLSMTKICDFPNSIYDLTKKFDTPFNTIGALVYVDGLTDNDKKVASPKKHTQFKTGVQKQYSI